MMGFSYLFRQNSTLELAAGGLVKDIKSGSLLSVLQELAELFRRNDNGGGAISGFAWPPEFDSGRGLGFGCWLMGPLSVSLTDVVRETKTSC